jgi:archaellum component FlaC
MRLFVTIAIVMWLFNKQRKNTSSEKGITLTESNQIKKLSAEWERLSNELAVVQQAFDAEQISYNHAIHNLSKQRLIFQDVYNELNEMKAKMSDYLKRNKINVNVFKQLSDDCVVAYLNYEHEHQMMADMENEFDASYGEWETRFESRLSKIHEMRQIIKGLEHEIKNMCADV